jgi:hypothetical protein
MATMYNNNLWAVTLVVGVICAVLAAVIARRKNRNVQEAVAVGAFLGVIGLLIVALLPSKAPAGMGKVVCLRCNKRQNVPSCQTTFECWQCKLVAQTPWSVGAGPSKGYVDDVIRNVRHGKRPAILLYAGDHDPSGWDIPRDFIARTDCWKHVERIALTPEQIAQGTVNLSNPRAIFAGSRPRFTRSRVTYEAYVVSRTSTRPQVDSAHRRTWVSADSLHIPLLWTKSLRMSRMSAK